ncbi:MAG: hypothetical protein ABIB46_01860 [bacterium]
MKKYILIMIFVFTFCFQSFAEFKNPSNIGTDGFSLGINIIVPFVVGHGLGIKEILLQNSFLELLPFVSLEIKKALGANAVFGCEVFPIGISLFTQFRILDEKSIFPISGYTKFSFNKEGDLSIMFYGLFDKFIGEEKKYRIYLGPGFGISTGKNILSQNTVIMLGNIKSIVCGIESTSKLGKNNKLIGELNYRMVKFANFQEKQKTFPFVFIGTNFYNYNKYDK